jgi:hypothetical protein
LSLTIKQEEMSTPGKKRSVLKKILIGIAILILLAAIAFQVFITRYLPSMVRERLADVIVKGSDSLYRFEVGKFDVSFWGGSVHFNDLKITIDTARYKKMEAAKRLPPLTFQLNLPAGRINGISIRNLVWNKKIDIRSIRFKSADIHLARHFRSADTALAADEPLWKLIQPNIRDINISSVRCDDLKMTYQNADSATSFRWAFNKCNVMFSGIRVDSASANDSSRLLFAKNVGLTAEDIKMKTPDGLYYLFANKIVYTSSDRELLVKDFDFHPTMNQQQFNRHWGYEHELYKLKIPLIELKNFQLPQWISYNRLRVDTVKLSSPSIAVHMDRNPRDNPYSKKGKYPQQLLQKAPFNMQIKRLKATDASMVYTETNDATQMTGKLVFSSLNGTIDNITNDKAALARSRECIANIRGAVMNKGSIHALFRFNLADRAGAFGVKATISNLDAKQLQPLFKAMTATDIQSFNMERLDYTMTGNENMGKGNLRMHYSDMDILLNKVEEDKTFNKRGFLSFLANRLVIYKENPKDGDERVATNIPMKRVSTRSFFNLVWKTLYTSAADIVLRPAAQRKIEKRKERQMQRNAKTTVDKRNAVSGK